MIVHVLILWGVIAAAVALAVVAHRRRARDEAPEYQSALTFVGDAYGLLLGLLVVFAVGHFNDVRRWEELDVTRLVVSPWRRSPDAVDGLRRFADLVGLEPRSDLS